MTLEQKYEAVFNTASKQNKALKASVFTDVVTVRHHDGSKFVFVGAFLRRKDYQGEPFVIVQTEHNGAQVFFGHDVNAKAEDKDTYFLIKSIE